MKRILPLRLVNDAPTVGDLGGVVGRADLVVEHLAAGIAHEAEELGGSPQQLPGPVELPITQELLSELVGGARPSVNQVLQRLVGEGVVRLGRGRITVTDRAGLADRAG